VPVNLINTQAKIVVNTLFFDCEMPHVANLHATTKNYIPHQSKNIAAQHYLFKLMYLLNFNAAFFSRDTSLAATNVGIIIFQR
jgi:hypothetical protein